MKNVEVRNNIKQAIGRAAVIAIVIASNKIGKPVSVSVGNPLKH